MIKKFYPGDLVRVVNPYTCIGDFDRLPAESWEPEPAINYYTIYNKLFRDQTILQVKENNITHRPDIISVQVPFYTGWSDIGLRDRDLELVFEGILC